MIKNIIKISVNEFAQYFKSKTYVMFIVLLWNYFRK